VFLVAPVAIRIAPFEFTKAALGIHQSATHLLELGDFLRNDLAGAGVDLATVRGHLGHRPVISRETDHG
jgi:hypothetical protein